MRTAAHRPLVPLLVVLAAACGRGGERAPVRQSGAATPSAASSGWNADAWHPPAVASLSDDALGRSIRRGLALLLHTRDSLPAYVGGTLTCTSCHLDEGRRAGAAPLTGVVARFPKYLDRTGGVVTIEDRVNYCFTRSLAGSRLPNDSREMRDIVAYLAFLSRGVPIGEQVTGQGLPKMPALTGDSARGRAVFVGSCARCHGADGAGMSAIPALWGASSFSVGASMARQERAASFVRHNMPFDRPGTLTDQQAFDVAAYVVSKPRPDSPGKGRDWPSGGAPADVPYATTGHAAHQPPPLLPRRHPEGAVVPAPRSVRER